MGHFICPCYFLGGEGGLGASLKPCNFQHPKKHPPKKTPGRPSLEMVLSKVFSPNPPGFLVAICCGRWKSMAAAPVIQPGWLADWARDKFTGDFTWYSTHNWRHSTSIKGMEPRRGKWWRTNKIMSNVFQYYDLCVYDKYAIYCYICMFRLSLFTNQTDLLSHVYILSISSLLQAASASKVSNHKGSLWKSHWPPRPAGHFGRAAWIFPNP